MFNPFCVGKTLLYIPSVLYCPGVSLHPDNVLCRPYVNASSNSPRDAASSTPLVLQCPPCALHLDVFSTMRAVRQASHEHHHVSQVSVTVSHARDAR